jgi:hypothetical protein
MPVTQGSTPTVSVNVPVPTPVQQPKRRPVSFGGEAPTGPTQPTGPSGVPPVQPPLSVLSSLILPWSPPPKAKTQMRRVGVVSRYSDKKFRHTTKDDARGFIEFSKGRGGWLHPDGSLTHADPLEHSDALLGHSDFLGYDTSRNGWRDRIMQEAYKKGHIRVVTLSGNVYVEGGKRAVLNKLSLLKDMGKAHSPDAQVVPTYKKMSAATASRLPRRVVRLHKPRT